MSVINKVLRDLDRQSEGDALARAPDLRRGTASVAAGVGLKARARRPSARTWLLGATLGVPLVLAAWYWGGSAGVPGARPAASPQAATQAPPARVDPNPAVAALPMVPSSPTPTPGAIVAGGAGQPPAPPVPVTLATEATPAKVLPSPERPATEAPAADKPPPAAPAPARAPAAPAGMISAAPAGTTATGTATVPPGPGSTVAVTSSAAVASVANPSSTRPVSAVPAWHESAQDTLSHAQRLWNEGARDQALDLLRDALLAVDRMLATDPGPAGGALALALLRERIRMDMAQGQPASVLSWIRRFERLAQREPDLLALRGHAAQRLGQHGEAVTAYLQALRLQPGEARWMLAAAVSLAATGQPAAAADWAEQSRAIAPISPEVLAYLRQAGVPLR